MPAPRVTCPECGKQQLLPLPGAGGRRWCSATYCRGKLDEALHGALMREIQDQAVRIGLDAAAEMLNKMALAPPQALASGPGSDSAGLNKKED